MVRLSADEMYDRIGKPGKGYDLEEGKRIAKRLEELGVDAINVSSACYDTYNYWLEPTSFEPGWRAYSRRTHPCGDWCLGKGTAGSDSRGPRAAPRGQRLPFCSGPLRR